MPQKLRVDQANERVMISCQVSDIDIVWRLAEAGADTSINVDVTLPEREAYRFDGQHQVISESLRCLTALAEAASLAPRPDAVDAALTKAETGPAEAGG
jgi:hypothetical protein